MLTPAYWVFPEAAATTAAALVDAGLAAADVAKKKSAVLSVILKHVVTYQRA
jgi:hypothetical protein